MQELPINGVKHMEKQIILLNGPSSSGKSTLSRALQGLIEEKGKGKYEIVSIDDFMKIATDETIYEDDVFEINEDMCRAAAEILKDAPGVIIDHVITSERIYQQLLDLLGNFQIRTVHVSCPLEVLLQREQARGNLCIGSAEASYTYLYPREGYDLTVDNAARPAEENAALICRLL